MTSQVADQADRSTRYERTPAAQLKQVGGTEALYIGERRALHVLNDTARVLMHCLDRPSTIAELALLMAQLTDAPKERLESDLGEVLPELEQMGAVRQVSD